MIIIHAMNDPHYPRLVARSLEDRMRVMPAVVLTGARQTGKSTLARAVGPPGRRYVTLDELDVMAAARNDSQALVGGGRPVTLDEVQRDPGLLLAVKREIDAARRPASSCSPAAPTSSSCARSPSPWPAGPATSACGR
jgi:predicted AAA+ superfamily ATPase